MICKKIMEAGLRAPSSKNSNPWFFVIVRGEQKEYIASIIERKTQKEDRVPINAETGEVATGAFDSTDASVQTIREAPVIVLVFNRAPMSGGNKQVMLNPRGGRSVYTYAGEMIGIGAAAENILLAAHALGLGAVYMADSYPARIEIQEMLKTEAEMIGSIAIGYSAYATEPREIDRSLVSTWDNAVKNGIPTEKNTAKIM